MRDLATGLRLFGRAAAMLARAPRLYLLGVVPALVSLLLFGSAFVLLLWHLDELAAWVTPFADRWTEAARQGIRVLAGVAVLLAAGMLGVISYTAFTLLIGGPLYDRLSARVEDWADRTSPASPAAAGGAEIGGWRGFWTGARDSAMLVLASLGCGVPVLLGGFLPVLGQTLVPVLAVGVGSWLLALELVGTPFQRRGLGLAQRRRALSQRRLLTLGASVPAYLLCAIPFTAAFAMPVAVAGGTLLAREVLAGQVPAGGARRPGVSGPRPAPPAPPACEVPDGHS